METKSTKKRTSQQNRALHLYFTMIADTLNEAGLDIKTTLKNAVEIPWNPLTVKELLWRPIQKVQLGKESTTQLTTGELDKVFDTLNRYLSTEHGITEEFPSIERLIILDDYITEKENRPAKSG